MHGKNENALEPDLRTYDTAVHKTILFHERSSQMVLRNRKFQGPHCGVAMVRGGKLLVELIANCTWDGTIFCFECRATCTRAQCLIVYQHRPSAQGVCAAIQRPSSLFIANPNAARGYMQQSDMSRHGSMSVVGSVTLLCNLKAIMRH